MADLIVPDRTTLRIDSNFTQHAKYGLLRMGAHSSILAEVDLVIVARRAEFGESCVIDARGRDGANGMDGGPPPPPPQNPPTAEGVNGRAGGDGAPGQNGRRVTIEAGLGKIGTLEILTDGGAGGRGGSGQAGGRGAAFGNGGNGGRGGNGATGGDAGEIVIRWTPLAADVQETAGQPPPGHSYRSQGGAAGTAGAGGAAGPAGGADAITRPGQPGSGGLAGLSGAGRVPSIEWRRRARTLLWVQRQNMGPSPRAGHALVWDVSRGRLVLFGGRNRSGVLRDTWEWDGELWVQVGDIGPSARGLHAMAYDPASAHVLLFGGGVGEEGQDGSTAFGDTWLWDGRDWIQVADSGPSPRRHFALATDPRRQSVVLFGGEVAQGDGGWETAGDTWEWNGTEWTQREDVGPSARAGASMAYDAGSEVLILFGGRNDAYPSDTWGWNGEHWKQVADMGPTGRMGHAVAADPNGVMLFGGRGPAEPAPAADEVLRDTWAYYDGRWRQIQDMGPAPRFTHAVAYDEQDQRVILFGGEELNGELLADTWYLFERPTPASR